MQSRDQGLHRQGRDTGRTGDKWAARAKMARPGLVRADTLDLQDQDKPTAAERQKHVDQNGVAPHQASQLHHVIEERHSEEQALSDAWNIADSLTEEPGAIEEAQANGEQPNRSNGAGEEGAEHGEGEAETEDDMMDRISSSPSIDDEDIDFEFVYALHTFVATVEGQANATKGDTMVLLDDSNSYWWLVRVVKDSSIGYLPAEHIETPTERLARLNKHRNIDLSATMLSDNSEKSRNPIKKAMRRRNTKTVQFAAPTYVEASDYDYTSDEDENAMPEPLRPTQTEDSLQNGHAEVEAAKTAAATAAAATTEPDKPLEVAEPVKTSTSAKRASFDREQAATQRASIDEPQVSPKLVDRTEAAPLKSRKGTPRNTDSFLKDDTMETRKITLTPGLLRDDSSVKSASSESMRAGSFETLVKSSSPPDQQFGKKDGKDKKKEKQKGGMLSGLFKSKKKDKKVKEDVVLESDIEKVSAEIHRDSRDSSRASPLASGGSSPVETVGSPLDARLTGQSKQAPGRSKLQKQQEPSPTSASTHEPDREESVAFVAELPGEKSAHETGLGWESNISEPAQRPHLDIPGVQSANDKENASAPIKSILSTSSEKDSKPKKATRSKQRVELDDFDSPPNEDDHNPFKEREVRSRGSQEESLDDSPVEITQSTTFMHGTELVHIPMPGIDEDEGDEEEPESLTSSPSVIEHPTEPGEEGEKVEPLKCSDSTPTASRPALPPASAETVIRANIMPTPQRGLSTDSNSSSSPLSPATPQQTWSDSNLRAWYDDGSEVKDMLLMIHDKTGLLPVPDDHPMMVGLFAEERKGIQKMMGDLDGLLGGYLKRKGVTF